jgi:hypothetical protein
LNGFFCEKISKQRYPEAVIDREKFFSRWANKIGPNFWLSIFLIQIFKSIMKVFRATVVQNLIRDDMRAHDDHTYKPRHHSTRIRNLNKTQSKNEFIIKKINPKRRYVATENEPEKRKVI